MELDQVFNQWKIQEQKLVEGTELNRELLKQVLRRNSRRHLDNLKLRMLAGLIISLLAAFFLLVNVEYSIEWDFLLGLSLFGSLSVLTFSWALRLYLMIDRLDIQDSLLDFTTGIKKVELYKLKTRRNSMFAAPFIVAGVFLVSRITVFSINMIPFYVAVILVFMTSLYVQRRYGILAKIRQLEEEIEELYKAG